MVEQTFYDRLMELCKKSNKSVKQIEEFLGYPKGTLHHFKNVKEPSAKRLLDLSYCLDVTPEYLLYGSKASRVKQTFYRLNTQEKLDMYRKCCEWLDEEEESIGI